MNDAIESPKAALNRRREMVLNLQPSRDLWLSGIDIKAASNIIAWVKSFRPKRKFESKTEDHGATGIHGVRIWRIK